MQGHVDRTASPRRHGVVILNYRGREDTLASISSLLQDPRPPTIYLVDNGSDDGVITAATARWEGIQAIPLPTNLGFSGGMNVGLRRALGDSCDVVTILNNDTVIPVGTMRRLSTLADNGLAISPVVRYLDPPRGIWFAGGVLDPLRGLPRHLRDEELPPIEDRQGLVSTSLLAGCCVTASAQTWVTAGLLDERFFLNFEDSEWSLRASRVGIELAICWDVEIYHRVSASFTREYSVLGYYYYARNGILFNKLTQDRPFVPLLRFLRYQALPPVKDSWEEGGIGALMRQVALLSAGILGVLTGRLGRAPARVERWANAWSRASP